MKVKDLLPMELDIDVYDDVCEELAIAYCGPMTLTQRGLSRFKEALEYDVEIVSPKYGGSPVVIVHVDDDDDKVWQRKLGKAKELFDAMAGYCSVDNFDRWFKF